MRFPTGIASILALAAAAVLACSCASELERSGRPFALINTRVLPFSCVTSLVPGEVVGRVEDAEAKFQAHGQARAAVGVAHRARVEGKDLSGVYVVVGAEGFCAPFDSGGSTAAVVYRGGSTAALTKLRNVVTFE